MASSVGSFGGNGHGWQILCDSASVEFIRLYVLDVVTGNLDFSDYEILTGLSYTFVGPIVDCVPGHDIEYSSLCDNNGTATKFIRIFVFSDTGALVSTIDIGLDGLPYTPTGTVGNCDVGASSTVLCDRVSGLPFFRWFSSEAGVAVFEYDTDLTGVPIPTVVDFVQCERDAQISAMCYNESGTILSGWRHFVYVDANILSTYYTDEEGNVLTSPSLVKCGTRRVCRGCI